MPRNRIPASQFSITNRAIYKEEVLGRQVEIQFKIDGQDRRQFYRGTVRKLEVTLNDDGSKEYTHYICFDDGDELWFDLAEIEGKGRLRWSKRKKNYNETAKEEHSDYDGDTLVVEGNAREPRGNKSRPSAAHETGCARAVAMEMWVCDVCKVQKFEDFDEACRHEEACAALGKEPPPASAVAARAAPAGKETDRNPSAVPSSSASPRPDATQSSTGPTTGRQKSSRETAIAAALSADFCSSSRKRKCSPNGTPTKSPGTQAGSGSTPGSNEEDKKPPAVASSDHAATPDSPQSSQAPRRLVPAAASALSSLQENEQRRSSSSDATTSTMETTRAEKRRRKRKVTLEKTSVDESGYIYTETQTVWEDVPSSEDEHELVAAKTIAPQHLANKPMNTSLANFFRAGRDSDRPFEAAPAPVPSSLVPRSLLNFFRKKPSGPIVAAEKKNDDKKPAASDISRAFPGDSGRGKEEEKAVVDLLSSPKDEDDEVDQKLPAPALAFSSPLAKQRRDEKPVSVPSSAIVTPEKPPSKKARKRAPQPTPVVAAKHYDFFDFKSDEIQLNDLEYWLKHIHKEGRLSASNAKRCMLRIRELVAGVGITYKNWPRNTYFYRGVKVNLTSDFGRMHAEAKLYEYRYGRDLGNGWLLQHPIKKLHLYRDEYAGLIRVRKREFLQFLYSTKRTEAPCSVVSGVEDILKVIFTFVVRDRLETGK